MNEHDQERRGMEELARTNAERAKNPFRSDGNGLSDSIWESVQRDMLP
jgi:hypothetical protein